MLLGRNNMSTLCIHKLPKYELVYPVIWVLRKFFKEGITKQNFLWRTMRKLRKVMTVIKVEARKTWGNAWEAITWVGRILAKEGSQSFKSRDKKKKKSRLALCIKTFCNDENVVYLHYSVQLLLGIYDDWALEM